MKRASEPTTSGPTDAKQRVHLCTQSAKRGDPFDPGTIIHVAALCALLFAYGGTLLSIAGDGDKLQELVLFAYALLLVPAIAGWTRLRVVRIGDNRMQLVAAAGITVWVASFLLAALAIAGVYAAVVRADAEFWILAVQQIVFVTFIFHAASIVAAAHPASSRLLGGRLSIPSMGVSTANRAFIASLMVALPALFRMDHPNSAYAAVQAYLGAAPIDDSEIGWRFLTGASVIAAILAIMTAGLVRWEQHLAAVRPTRIRAVRRVAFGVAIAALVALFFDFSIKTDAMHYMTNIGPALHVMHGGTLMVDAFSQYGPGPVAATLAGFLLGPESIGVAALVVQSFNFAFYALWLLCLCRLCRFVTPAMVVAIGVVAILLSVWGWGYSAGLANLNMFPSIIGFRYLPALMMTAAISFLRPPARHSALTIVAAFFAALWSLEAIVGALWLHLALIVFLNVRARSFRRLVADCLFAFAPVAAGLLTICAYTLASAGVLPDFVAYLQFFTSYNPLSDYWARDANPMFLGWAAPLLAVVVVASDALTRAFVRNAAILPVTTDMLYYRVAPMALLAVFMSLYYVGRPVEFTLVIALLPVAALFIPAAFSVSHRFAYMTAPGRIAAVISIGAAFFAVGAAILSLAQPASGYSFALHECRDHRTCTPAALKRKLGREIAAPHDESLRDTERVIDEAVEQLAKYRAIGATVEVMLGPPRGEYHMASEFALMRAGLWHGLPRSLTFTDALSPRISAKVIAAARDVGESAIVIARSNEAFLGALERNMLEEIRRGHDLCALPGATTNVVAYRVAAPGECPDADISPPREQGGR